MHTVISNTMMFVVSKIASWVLGTNRGASATPECIERDQSDVRSATIKQIYFLAIVVRVVQFEYIHILMKRNGSLVNAIQVIIEIVFLRCFLFRLSTGVSVCVRFNVRDPSN